MALMRQSRNVRLFLFFIILFCLLLHTFQQCIHILSQLSQPR